MVTAWPSTTACVSAEQDWIPLFYGLSAGVHTLPVYYTTEEGKFYQ